jgi:hypothetical protein
VFDKKIPNLKTEFGTRIYNVFKDLQAKFQNSNFFQQETRGKRKKVEAQDLFSQCKVINHFSTEGGYHLKIYWNFGIFIYIYIYYYYYYYYL